MDRSLSYILPVKNAQGDLSRQVERLLDMLSELTPWFELLIVDEGSHDDTADVAHDLAQRYPQVNTAYGSEDELNDLMHTMGKLNGEIVFLADRDATPDSNELRQLWNMRHDDKLVMARMPRGPENLSDDLITRLMSWGEALQDAGDVEHTASVRMIRRSAMMRMSENHPAREFAY